MKTIISWFLIVFLTGCMTNVPCPENMNRPGELCHVLMIPTPMDPVVASLELISTIRAINNSGKRRDL